MKPQDSCLNGCAKSHLLSTPYTGKLQKAFDPVPHYSKDKRSKLAYTSCVQGQKELPVWVLIGQHIVHSRHVHAQCSELSMKGYLRDQE